MNDSTPNKPIKAKKLASVAAAEHDQAAAPSAPHHQTNQSNGLAVTSLILGILSLSGAGLLLGIPAIIFGIVALRKSSIDRGLSWAGIITGAISTALSLLAILAVAALFIIMLVSGGSQMHDFDSGEFPLERTQHLERA